MKICFWGNIAGALKGNTAGGGELQLALLAKALSKGGHEVVILDFLTKEDYITSEGINIFKINGWNNGFRIIRTFTHRLPQLYYSLKAQKADVYYCRIRDFRHIFAYWAARKVKAKFILGLASDLDAMNFMMRLKYQHFISSGSLWGVVNGFLIEIVYPWMLRKADLVLVQHEGQKNILHEKSIKSFVLPNLFDITIVPNKTSITQKNFIFVGELDERKGFAELFEIINKSPLHSFKVVGQPCDKIGYKYYAKLHTYKNVELFGRLSHPETMNQIANSIALISTSPMEGFPNIFIEAWACGIPVLSLYVDPGGIIEKEKLGEVAHGNIDKLIETMNKINNTKEFTLKAKSYVERNHTMNSKKIKEISELFS